MAMFNAESSAYPSHGEDGVIIFTRDRDLMREIIEVTRTRAVDVYAEEKDYSKAVDALNLCAMIEKALADIEAGVENE